MKKILIIDDSPTDQARLRSLLTDMGCSVVVASSGKEGVEKARIESPHLIFLDVVMPETDGYEACKILHKDPATQKIPVVFVTSKSQKADVVWGQLQGAKGHIGKPFRPEDVVDAVKKLAL